ncbi:hypothetical protein [Bilophila wadsworthia]|uniref:hypothetical protein n=1 Tax=Bilophila wadsworthia TaxID=35833 RepID=UPI00242EAFC5|nr:hypothetical protein [Bilophila wadsworthia]
MTCRFDEQCNRITFMGRVWERPLSEWPSSLREVKFPVEAFKDFLRAEGLPMPDFWQTKTGSTDGHIKPDPAVCPVTAAPSLPNECREVEPPKTAPAAAPSVAPRVEGAGVDLSEGPKGGTLPDDYEIVPGVTVGHIRALFDQSGERYSPELAAAVFAWASFEKDPAVAAGWTVKEEIKNGRLPDWEGPPLSTEAKKRIAIVVNWDKTPAKH